MLTATDFFYIQSSNIYLKNYFWLATFLLLTIVIFFILRKLFFFITNLFLQKNKNKFILFLVRQAKKFFDPIAIYLIIYALSSWLTINNEWARKIINAISLIIIIIIFMRFTGSAVNYLLRIYWVKDSNIGYGKETRINTISRMVSFLLWAIAAIFLLDNLGFKVSSVITGLGIGGVAVALAAQAVLGDLFSYLAIFFDKPFEIGDFIIVGDIMGTVEYVGLKTVRIASLGGEQIIMSNTDITNSRVKNYKRMYKRRVLFKVGFTYNTSLDKLKELPNDIKNIITNIEDTIFDRAHFASYGDFCLLYEIVYYVVGNDYNKYMDIQQLINFNLKEYCINKGIEFAFPTQTLYLKKEN